MWRPATIFDYVDGMIAEVSRAEEAWLGPAIDGRPAVLLVARGENRGIKVRVERTLNDAGEQFALGWGWHPSVLTTVDQHSHALELRIAIRRALDRAARRGRLGRLTDAANLPGSRIQERTGRWAIPVAPPAWAPGAQAWDTREGVYVAFPDGFCRLVPKRDYWQSHDCQSPPDVRQDNLREGQKR